MSEHLPKDPSPALQEDLQEAAFAALRRLLAEVRAEAALTMAASAAVPMLDRIDAVLTGDPGQIFLAHMQRLEAENATLREDVVRFLAENARIRGLLAHFAHCPHGCEDAPVSPCPHYRKVRELGLRS